MSADPAHADALALPELLPGRGVLRIVAVGDVDDGDVGEPPLREFLEAVGVAIYTTDAAGRITFYNDAATTLWGRRPALGEEWCGSWRLYWKDGLPMRHDECPMAVALRERRPVRGEDAVAERPDGSRVAFMPYPTPLLDAAGNLVGAVNVLVDITERRDAEEDLRASARALQASNAVKDEFLGLVSHELRTPVTTIFGNARLLREKADRLGEVDKASMIEDIAHDSERLLGIIENLLLLTRLEAGSHVDLEPQVLGHVIRKAVDSFRRRHPGRRVDFTSDTGHVVVEADRTYLDLLMENLLANADKYSPPSAAIEVALSVDGEEARIVVLDRGIGIAASELDRIFSAFYRGEAAKSRANGLGIGLAVCRRMVETQGGRIWARQREGGGSELGFALPLAPEMPS